MACASLLEPHMARERGGRSLSPSHPLTRLTLSPSHPSHPLTLLTFSPSHPLTLSHSYAVGGGLFEPGHRDCGSVLSMSVLLSDPVADGVNGGEFVTWADGEPVVHAMRGGDAVLFHSGKAHNVARVTSSVRHSLVIELWVGPTNLVDREQ